MKRIISLLLFLLFLTACNIKPEVKYNYDIECKDADMSEYVSMQGVEHCFKLVKPSELVNCVENDGSGIFYLGYGTCPFCNKVIHYLNEVGMEMGVTIYYIDAMNTEEPIIGNNENIRALTSFLEPILDKDPDTDKKVLMTPHVFTVVNGEFYQSYVSLPYKLNGDVDFDDPPTEAQINKVKKTLQKKL